MNSNIIVAVRAEMSAALAFAFFVSAIWFVGCTWSGPSTAVSRPQSVAAPNLEQRVGQRVVLEGTVTNTKCPQVQGVDAWDLHEYRGKRVRISGILRKTVIAEADVDMTVANRGAGTFYSLDEMKYELLK
jgi:hypothetical protein